MRPYSIINGDARQFDGMLRKWFMRCRTSKRPVVEKIKGTGPVARCCVFNSYIYVGGRILL